MLKLTFKNPNDTIDFVFLHNIYLIVRYGAFCISKNPLIFFADLRNILIDKAPEDLYRTAKHTK